MKEGSPIAAMKALIKAHNGGLPNRFEKLTKELSQLGKPTLDEDRILDQIEAIHEELMSMPFEASVELELEFGVKSPEYEIGEFPGLLSDFTNNVVLLCDTQGIPREGASVVEMVEFDVVDDIGRVKDAMSWRNHKRRMEIGNLISFYPFPPQAEGHVSALTHDHVLILMCHRHKEDSMHSDGTRGVAVMLDRHGMKEIAAYARQQADEISRLTMEEIEQNRVESMDETYQAITSLLEHMVDAAASQVEDDLLNLKAWEPTGKPQ